MTMRLKKISGFTLIEMSVVVLLVGIALAAFAPLYKLYVKNQELQKTRQNIETVNSALSAFRNLNGRYPFPAPITVRTNANYGREAGGAVGGGLPAAPTVAPGNLDPLGYYLAASPRILPAFLNPFVAGNPPVVNQAPPVRIGFVPFRLLNIDEDVSYDGQGNHIMYAVTEHLASGDTFRPGQGGIGIIDAAGVSVIEPANSADFVVYSMGENQNGAYPPNAVQFACAPGVDRMNCTLPMAVATFRKAPESSSFNVASRYDDVLSYFLTTETPLWQLSTAPGAAKDIHTKVPGMVGVSFNPLGFPVSSKNQILGEIRAQDDPDTNDGNPATINDVEGNILSKQLCSSSGACFPITLITGSLTSPGGGMECPADDPDGVGAFMVGVRNGRPICEDELKSGCFNPGEALAGYDANHVPICQNVYTFKLPCAAASTSPCSSFVGGPFTSLPIPASNHGTVVTIPATGYFGHSRQETWQCTNGTWNRLTATGLCSCADTETKTVACQSGFTGPGFTQTRTRPAPGCATIPPPAFGLWLPALPPTTGTVTYPPGTCGCTNTYESRNISCPPGQVAALQPYEDRTLTCAGPNSGTWSPWVQHNLNLCACPADQTQTVTCPAPLTGSFVQTNHLDCSASPPAWSGWTPATPPPGTCTCTAGPLPPRTGSCPTPLVGTVIYHDTVVCPGGTITTTTDSSGCTTPPPAVCSIKQNGTGTASATPTANPVGTVCTCGSGNVASCHAGSSPYQIYYGCPCTP